MTCERVGNAIVCSRGGKRPTCPICGTTLDRGAVAAGKMWCGDCRADALRDPQFAEWAARQAARR